MKKTLIERIELTSAAASIEFTSIPADYTDLYLVLSARSSDTNDECLFLPNASSSNLSFRLLRASGTSVISASALRFYLPTSSSTANTFGNGSVLFTNYASSSPKSFSMDSVAENNATVAPLGINAGLWNDTTPISSLRLQINNSATGFAANSSFSLYGVTSGNDGITTVS
jgi:hypothetical protein